MAPLVPLLNAVLAITSDSPDILAPWQISTTATGFSTVPSIVVSSPGPRLEKYADTMISATIAAASTQTSSSTIALSAEEASTNHILELRQDRSSCGSGYVPCSNPAGIICVGSHQFGICAMNNCALVQDLAPGVDCAIFSPITYAPPLGSIAPGMTSAPGASTPSTSLASQSTTASSPSTQSSKSQVLSTSTSSGTTALVVTLSASSTSTSKPTSTSMSSPTLSTTSYPISSVSSTCSTAATPSESAPVIGSWAQYTTYTGNGALFPNTSDWISSFDDMWTINLNSLINTVCAKYGANSQAESDGLKSAILTAATASGLDARFILALVMQESRGCVRVVTTIGSHANPGLLQDYAGPSSCNVGGVADTPCPNTEITGMINDGVFGNEVPGQAKGPGLLQNYRTAGTMSPVSDAARYYITSRIYNSGSYVQNNLGCGVATHCYVSDVANRLRGWAGDSSPCNSDQVFAGCT